MMEETHLRSLLSLYSGVKNFVFIGEAGCGKSELSINLALSLAAMNDKPVHFYDLDMTKPLFRSRDQATFLERLGVHVHYEEQFYDAPTVAGGVTRLLEDETVYTILDVGGDYIGARAVGGYAPLMNRQNCAVFYVINPYRPWSMDIEHIDKVLGQTLGVSHVELDRLHIVGNPNLGVHTTVQDVAFGVRQLREMVGPYKAVEFYAVHMPLLPSLQEELHEVLIPIKLYLTYEREEELSESF